MTLRALPTEKTLEELKMKPEAASGLAESIINIVQYYYHQHSNQLWPLLSLLQDLKKPSSLIFVLIFIAQSNFGEWFIFAEKGEWHSQTIRYYLR